MTSTTLPWAIQIRDTETGEVLAEIRSRSPRFSLSIAESYRRDQLENSELPHAITNEAGGVIHAPIAA